MQPKAQSDAALALAALAPVIPVIVIEEIAHARPLAEALVAGGLPVLEVTLRTSVALEAMRAMAEVEGARVGAGTVLSREDMARAQEAGAEFAVAPGATPALVAASIELGLPFLPGAATATEAMALLEQGYHFLKLFPAEAVGGTALLSGLRGPLPQIRFCPTGGISAAKAPAYLAEKNVACVGGSWVAPPDLMRAGDWAEIERRAREAASLARG